eukprot:Skav230639  [mRNA]  locus=scaffold1673:359250:360473:+ [translate_table: standard]
MDHALTPQSLGLGGIERRCLVQKEVNLADNIVSWGSTIASGACTAAGLLIAAEFAPVLIVTGVVVGGIGGLNEVIHGAAREDPWRVASGVFGVATSAAGGVSQWLKNVKHVKYAQKAVKAAKVAQKAKATVEKAERAAQMTAKAATVLKQAKVAEAVNKGISATQSCVTAVKDLPAAVESLREGDVMRPTGWGIGAAGGFMSVGAAANQCGDAFTNPWKGAVGKAGIAKDARSAVKELAQATRQKGPNPVKIVAGHETKSLAQAARWCKEALVASSDDIQETYNKILAEGSMGPEQVAKAAKEILEGVQELQGGNLASGGQINVVAL